MVQKSLHGRILHVGLLLMNMINFLVLPATISPNPVREILPTKSFAVEAEYLYSMGFPVLLSGGQILSWRILVLVTSILR